MPDSETTETGSHLVPYFFPHLAQILALAEKEKGSALTEAEVLAARDKAPCIMVPWSTAKKMQAGFRDVNPENCWADWHRVRVQMTGQGSLPQLVICLLSTLECKTVLREILNSEKIDYEFRDRDSRMLESFKGLVGGINPSLTQEDLDMVDEHSLVLYLLSEQFSEEQAPQQCYRFLKLVCKLLQSGAVAAKCESSGIAHSAARWIELFKSCSSGTSIGAPIEDSKLGDNFWNSLFHAYVQLPIDSSEDYYSCGMHLLGLPDVIISKSLLQTALPENVSLTDAVAYLFGTFNLYLLDECPQGEFLSGNTFQPDLDFPSFRVIWEPCQGFSDDGLYFNLYGRWRFATLGKNSKPPAFANAP